jgi:hypothetical protein
MKEDFQNIETTFGQIRIFKNTSNKSKSTESISKNKEKEIVNLEHKVLEENKSNDQDQDFFGFDRNEKKDLNFFDQNIVNQYELNKEPKSKSDPTKINATHKAVKNITSDLENEKDLNFVDEFYFKNPNDSQIENILDKSDELNAKSDSKNITKKDLELIDDANFIDQQMFTSESESKLLIVQKSSYQRKQVGRDEDISIGSIRNLKEKYKPKKKPTISEEIPIIQSKNITEDDENEANFQLRKPSGNNNPKKMTSQHKILQSEIPNWNFITLEEAAKILKSHICYHDEERKKFGFKTVHMP